MKFTKNIGMLLLGAWLIVHGLQGLVDFNFSGLNMIRGVVASVAGALILVGK